MWVAEESVVDAGIRASQESVALALARTDMDMARSTGPATCGEQVGENCG